MPPKAKTSREELLNTTMRLVREKGEEGLSARMITKEAGCSTQPIYMHFGSMENLKNQVVSLARAEYDSYLQKEIEKEKYDPYQACGLAHIRFGKNEKELFKLLFLNGDSFNEEQNTQEIARYVQMVTEATGIEKSRALYFHLEMWAFIHGIATMLATGRLQWDGKIITRMIADGFEGLISRYETEE